MDVHYRLFNTMTLSQIKYLLTAILIAASLYFMYSKIYHYGYEAAEQKYTKVIQEYNDRQTKQVQELEGKITSLLLATSAYNTILIKDIDSIKLGLYNKPLVIYKDGKCALSKEFIDSRNAAIDRANKR